MVVRRSGRDGRRPGSRRILRAPPRHRRGGARRRESVDYPSGTSGTHTKPSPSTMNASRSPCGLSAAPCRTSQPSRRAAASAASQQLEDLAAGVSPSGRIEGAATLTLRSAGARSRSADAGRHPPGAAFRERPVTPGPARSRATRQRPFHLSNPAPSRRHRAVRYVPRCGRTAPARESHESHEYARPIPAAYSSHASRDVQRMSRRAGVSRENARPPSGLRGQGVS